MKNQILFILLFVAFSVSGISPQITKYTIEPTGIPDVGDFGAAVGCYGEYIVVGAPLTHSNGIYEQGAVIVYKKNENSEWVLEQILFPSDSIPENHVGTGVAMNNEFIIASNAIYNGEWAAYIFKLNSSGIWEEFSKITGLQWYCDKILISGDYATIVGTFGYIQIYYFNGSDWIEQFLTPSLASENNLTISTDGEYIIVGDRTYNGNSGRALIYKRNGDVWNEQVQIYASDKHFDHYFGASVSIDGAYAVVGASDEFNPGAAYEFKRDGSNWLEQSILQDVIFWDRWGGHSVLIKENYVVLSSIDTGLSIYHRARVINPWNVIYYDEEGDGQISITNDFVVAGGDLVYVYEGLNITSVESNNDKQLKSFTMNQNYPNPFNPITTIKYQIPELSFVTLKVYDVLGNEIVVLVNEEKSIGSYQIEFDAANLSSGVYFYRLQVYPTNGGAGTFVETKKMVLMK